MCESRYSQYVAFNLFELRRTFHMKTLGFAPFPLEHELMRDVMGIKFVVLLMLGSGMSVQADDLLDQFSAPPAQLVQTISEPAPRSEFQTVSYAADSGSCSAVCKPGGNCGAA